MSKEKKEKSMLDLITAENIQEVNSDKEGLEESMKRFNEVTEFLFATNEVQKVLKEKDNKISDLEAKLAESEEKLKSSWYEICPRCGNPYGASQFLSKDKKGKNIFICSNCLKIEEIYEPLIKQLEDQNDRLINQRDNAILQLAEKEKEFEWLHQKFAKYVENNQDKISFAVSKLEKVSDWIIQHRVKPFFEERYIVYTKSLGSMIEEEIEKLKGGK